MAISKDDPLTPAEEVVFSELAYGKSNKEIARQLGISEGTVKLHCTAIFKKLDVTSRVQAALMFHGVNVKRMLP